MVSGRRCLTGIYLQATFRATSLGEGQIRYRVQAYPVVRRSPLKALLSIVRARIWLVQKWVGCRIYFRSVWPEARSLTPSDHSHESLVARFSNKFSWNFFGIEPLALSLFTVFRCRMSHFGPCFLPFVWVCFIILIYWGLLLGRAPFVVWFIINFDPCVTVLWWLPHGTLEEVFSLNAVLDSLLLMNPLARLWSSYLSSRMLLWDGNRMKIWHQGCLDF